MTGDFSVEVQALKSLSYRSPYDAEELLSRLTTLPASVGIHLSRQSDGLRKFKKSASGHGDDLPAKSSSAKPSKGSAPTGVWATMEEFFRPITAEDIQNLIRDLSPNDHSFSIPAVETTVSVTWAEKGLSFDGGSEVEVEAEKVEELEEEEKVEEEKNKVGEKVEEKKNKAEEEKEKAEEVVMETTSCSLEAQEEGEGEGEGEEDEGMGWLLGSKHRVILTTQRPTKKRKLLGTDAGLDQLLCLPHSQEVPSSPRCDICCLGKSVAVKSKNRLVSCTSCSICFHRNCYGLGGVKEDTSVVCSWCEHLSAKEHNKGEDMKNSKRPCVLCPRPGGALKLVEGKSEGGADEKFAHLFCGMWTPEVYVEDTVAMEPVMNVEGIPETKTKLVCNVCKVKHGVCVRCSYGTCRTVFHPICAREARHRMEIWGKFGCDNVELRAFCAKHSTSQDIGKAQHSVSLTRNVRDDSSVTKPPTAPLLMKKLPKLRLSRKNNDKSTTHPEMADAVSDEVVKNRTNLEQDAVAISCSPEDGDVQSNEKTTIGVSESEKSLPSASNLILLFKLIGRGKIIIGDIASDMGIPSNTLEEALSGEISSELRLNITKWLQNSIHMPASTRHLKSRNGSATSSDNVRFEDPDNVDDCPVKSLPPRIRTKSNIRILKEDDKVSSGETLHQSCNGKLVNELGKESKDSISQIDDEEEDVAGNLFPTHDEDHCCEREAPLEMVAVSTDSDPSQNPDSEPRRNSTKVDSNDLSKIQCRPHKEEHVSVKHANGHADEPYIHSDDTIKKESLDYRDGNMAFLVSATPDHRVDGSRSGSCIHPYIKKRLTQVQRDALLQHKSSKADSNDSTVNQVVPHTCSNLDPMLDVAQLAPLDQLAKAGNTGILELCPEDEVEGELLYLQKRLVDNAVAIKHSCEDLLGKIVKKLPMELNALKKQQWDLVLVNQYLREVREAKKHVRKERKRREAQAVLAAAAAAAAASSRNPSLRKDSSDENPLNISTVSGRASGHSPLEPRLTETPRSSVKVSPDKHSIFQIPEFSKENELSCEICRRPETLLNRIFVCSSCKVAVHLDCYCKLKDPIGPWKCELCEEISHSGSPRNVVAKCWLCGGGSGALRKSADGQWVHAFCAEWLMETTFRRGQLNHVDGMDVVSKEKDLLTCVFCHQKFGVCSKCSYGNCQITFHPLCARTAGLYVNVKSYGGRLHHKAYCEKHSLEQRQKADNQQYGTEELKNIKQIRVELEKLRLLCERIIKREKVKRDLVICSHDVLASKRDYVAFSVRVLSSFPLGVSSESATTSIDNKSYSGTMQRSEDITIYSTVSGKHNVKISIDMDHKTDDSSTSQLSFKRKIADRISFSGKQLPQRATSVPVQNLAHDLERSFKPRKHAESFHKEVVMTSYQASMQNQRLPKGFAYVPVGYLSKEKPVIHDSESHEPQEPGRPF